MNPITLRDYHAAHAPETAPSWFQHASPAKPLCPHPDNCQPGEWTEVIQNAWDDWYALNQMVRLAQWRYAFADAMLQARGDQP